MIQRLSGLFLQRTVEYRRPLDRILAVVFVLAALFAFWSDHLKRPFELELPVADAKHYLTMGYHLAMHGVLSKDDNLALQKPPPTAHRLPVYPAFIAAAINASPEIKALPPEKLFTDKPTFQGFRPVLYALFWVYVLMLFLCGVMVALLTGWWSLGGLAMWLMALYREDNGLLNRFFDEPFSAFLMVGLGLCLMLAIRRESLFFFILAGLMTAALILTKGIFYYFIPIAIVFFLLPLTSVRNRKRYVAGILLFALTSFASAWLWKQRNLKLFGRDYLSARGGVVLDIRANYDLMSHQQYWASFPLWSGSDKLADWAESRFGAAVYEPLGRELPTGMYQRAKSMENAYPRLHRRIQAILPTEEQRMAAEAWGDEVQKRNAMRKIKTHPFRHIAVTVPMFIKGAGELFKPFWGPLSFLLLLAVFCAALIRRHAILAAALLPGVFSLALYTFLTHNIARYNMPVVPFVYIAWVVSGYYGTRFLYGYLRSVTNRL
jgi:hypothetical protein